MAIKFIHDYPVLSHNKNKLIGNGDLAVIKIVNYLVMVLIKFLLNHDAFVPWSVFLVQSVQQALF